jgi:hypothetical protein
LNEEGERVGRVGGEKDTPKPENIKIKQSDQSYTVGENESNDFEYIIK